MRNKNEIIKIAILILIVLIAVITIIMFYKKDKEEIITTENFLDVESNEVIENISKDENNKIKVYVTGEVNEPGVIELNKGSRIEDAINLAGGITNQADISEVNLAYVLKDGQKLKIPNFNDKEIIEYLSEENGNDIIEGSNTISTKINLNTANVANLQNLPGVGEAMAQKIVTYREEKGKFESIEDLKNVNGIGDKKFESLKEYITVK